MSANRIRDYLYRSSEENEEKKKEKKNSFRSHIYHSKAGRGEKEFKNRNVIDCE